MVGSQRRPRDSNPEVPSVMFFEQINAETSIAKTVEAIKPLCSVVSEEATIVNHYSLRSASTNTRLDISGGDLDNGNNDNGCSLDYYPRKPQTRSVSKDESLQVLTKANDSSITNERSKTPAPPANKPVKVDISSNISMQGKKIREIDDRIELVESIHNPKLEEPVLSTKYSSRRRISFRSMTSSCGKKEIPDDGLNETQTRRLDGEESVRNGKRSRKEVEIKIESTGENKKGNLCKVENLAIVGSDLNGEDDVSRKKAKWTLQTFHSIYNRLSQDTESDLKSKFDFRRNRLDLMALKMMKESSLELKTDSLSIGSVPGVEIGDEFNLRVELCVLGLHRQLQGGIDFFKQDGRLLARSIISSGSSRYSDNGHVSEVLIYSGSGVSNRNQKLEYGNLALKNSIDAQNPIRVIWGVEDIQINNSRSYRGRKATRYIYDGLYLAEKYWMEKNDDGCDIFMFQLRRKKKQPELKIKNVKLRTSISFSDICIEDISNGKEKIPICAVNTIDKESPQPFTYTKEMIYPSNHIPISPKGCDCVGICTDSIKCACAVKNGGELPFNSRGAIVQAKPLVYECGPSCKCPPSCHNRVSQHGIKFPLEVFKTGTMGWGLRSLSLIPSGSFVCEYVGELIQDEEAQRRTNDEYLFAIGNNYHDVALWEGLPTSIPELQKKGSSLGDETNYTVDASMFGNVARFINHSCMPNLYAQNLLFDHGNTSMPHIMLFASEDIPPLQELTYHYNYTIDQVHDSNGNIKQKVCYCGTVECTGRLY
ncbi:histone-lysine N-methyltransferase, H3 lysine-9 specific SUVH5 isoform X1 [Dendrobium catenatum]|uniref:Histone-lysine N-methyltransferase, H3 lysine-9 specific SUVH5 n=1 Tax=Dendrobium catenatum TaxID=906689 RepID=A0A2I0XCQ6_9ASPA|nr:histone-lysine N-methyltransferase, H3 lysine-9 specific SUVH5 isoform X1 [Dendrobium catenatum]PKU85683.1 Histone-lysine N-methyltransferase, H3 lysine-9 specific SUVH5 [Dendrobium catenatum]